MKKTILLFLMTLFMSINVLANDVKLTFNSVRVNLPCKLLIVEGDTCSYKVATDKYTLDAMDCKIVDDVLIIDKKEHVNMESINFDNIRIYIQSPKDIDIDLARNLEIIENKKRKL